jgi:hypothetical protein
MIANRMKRTLPLAAVTATISMLAGVAGAQAATAPVKEIVSSHFGREVNLTEVQAHAGPLLEDICTVVSKDECQPGSRSSLPGGFEYPDAVAGGPTPEGNVYVADRGNHRVQEFTATGQFVLMFGKEVNKKGGDVCTKAEESECRAGVEGSAPGQFGETLHGIAVDPVSGDVYVAEMMPGTSNRARVQKFTTDGRFVLEIGKGVNETTTGNLCTEQEVETKGVKCTGPAQYAGGTKPEPGAFVRVEAVAVGGPEDLLYVGDANGVQEFQAKGLYQREIRAAGTTAIAVDNTGDVYSALVGGIIGKFGTTGEHTEFTTAYRGITPGGIAVNPAGRLAVAGSDPDGTHHGRLYEVGATKLHLITEFAAPFYLSGIAFNGNDELYGASNAVTNYPGTEVIAYVPKPVGELATKSAACKEGAVHESKVTFDCSLNGEVDPWGVSETEVRFEWGRTSQLGEKTARQPIKNEKEPPVEGQEEALVKVSASIEDVVPNEALDYQLAAQDHWVKVPELLTGEMISYRTSTVPPRIVHEPSVSYVHPSSAVMFGELNPENAKTRYEFQYVRAETCQSLEESCPGMTETQAQESPAYGSIGTTLEATGLQPATTYRYRLYAVNNKGEPAVNATGGKPVPEGEFETAPAPVPRATTGAFSALSATSATISGAVDPDGPPATYTFELGIYNGANTQFGIVFSGLAGASVRPVEETLDLSGLQPGTTYAYRIKVASGYGTAMGATATFTTTGLPEVLVVQTALAQLPVPSIVFPAAVTSKSTTKALTNAQKLAKALTACKKKAKKQRAACQKQARKKYPKSKQANNRKKG